MKKFDSVLVEIPVYDTDEIYELQKSKYHSSSSARVENGVVSESHTMSFNTKGVAYHLYLLKLKAIGRPYKVFEISNKQARVSRRFAEVFAKELAKKYE